MPTHRTLLAATALATAATALATGAAAPSDNPHSAIRNPQSPPPAARPNIIFVFADQWRKQALGYRHEDPVQTPNLDKFATWAFSFDNATSTNPVCGPNRACLMTGLYPANHGVFANSVPLSPETPTLGDLCKAAGYATAYIGKWHLNGPSDPVTTPDRRHGFDLWVQSVGHTPFNQLYYKNDTPTPYRNKNIWGPTYETATAIDFIQKNQAENKTKNTPKPFCVVLSYAPPHTSGGLGFEDRWQPGRHTPDGKLRLGYGYGGPKNYEALYNKTDYLKNPIRGNVRPITTRGYTDHSEGCIPGYFGAITAIDNDFGTLMTYLEKEHLLENTIVVFTADHGESMGSQGQMTKGTWFEESTGIPAIIGWKNHTIAQRATCVYNSIDQLPTILGLAGVPAPANLDGHDYSPLLRGQPHTPPKYAYLSFYFGGIAELKAPRYWRALYSDRYTLVLCGMNRNRDKFTHDGLVLYDRQTDPLQLHPIYKGDAHDTDALIADLYDTLAAHLKATNDPFIEKYWNNPNPGYPQLNHTTMDLDDYRQKLETGQVRGPRDDEGDDDTPAPQQPKPAKTPREDRKPKQRAKEQAAQAAAAANNAPAQY